jgi:hypothetical protein
MYVDPSLIGSHQAEAPSDSAAVASARPGPKPSTLPLSVLVLYDPRALQTNFVRGHLESFRTFLPHHVHYAEASFDCPLSFTLAAYDVVIIHFTIRVGLGWHLAPAFAAGLKAFTGLKVLFLQDEYDSPLVACHWIKELGIRAVFTCVPPACREAFYPRALVGDVAFVHNLTGYVPTRLEDHTRSKPLSRRPIVLGYRGRVLPFRYGQLAREKFEVGRRMKELCARHHLPHDIEWSDEARLDGNAWYEFLGNCRAMLGTESGSNVVDADGSLQRALEAELARTPGLTYEQAFERYVRPHDGKVQMNQVPPKVFEAVALRTALVLFEGEYSGVIRPHTHFIPLRKDFSNVREVLARLQDVPYLEQLTERAHRDVIRSGRYSYAVLMKALADVLEAWAPPPRPRRWVYAVVACDGEGVDWPLALRYQPYSAPLGIASTQPQPFLRGWLGYCWRCLPESLRRPLRTLLKAPLVSVSRRLSGRVRHR